MVRLTFADCLADSPGFRAELRRAEDRLDRRVAALERVCRACDGMVAKGVAYEQSVRTFLQELRGLGTGDQHHDPLVGEVVQRFAGALEELEECRAVLLQQARVGVADTLRCHVQAEVGQVRETGRLAHKLAAETDHARTRFLGLPKAKAQEAREAGSQLAAVKAKYQHTLLDYVCSLYLPARLAPPLPLLMSSKIPTDGDVSCSLTCLPCRSIWLLLRLTGCACELMQVFQMNRLTDVEGTKIVERAFSYMNSQSSYYTQAHDIVRDLDPYLRALAGKVCPSSCILLWFRYP